MNPKKWHNLNNRFRRIHKKIAELSAKIVENVDDYDDAIKNDFFKARKEVLSRRGKELWTILCPNDNL